MGASTKLLERAVELYNAGDLDGYMDLYAEDAVQTMPDGTFEGRNTIRERLARELAAFPDATYIVGSVVEQGDTCADEFIFVGTQTGPYPLPDGTQVPPTGKRMEIRGMELVRVRDGKIVIDNLYYDSMAALVQLWSRPAERDRVIKS